MPPTVDPPLDAELRALQDACRGRFAVEHELGRGGMGIVVLARDLSLDRHVAIKLLPTPLARQPHLRERFLREARTAAGLAHPNIVPVHAVEAHGDVVFFVMGYVEGETLGRRVLRTGPVSVADATRVLRDVAWALAYAHGRGVVHRDIKPDNILIDRGSGRALVTDFGIARVADAPTSLTLDGHLMGTAQYMSPEQAAGEPLDGRSDLYALGVTGFLALTGSLPFEARTAAGVLAARLTQPAPPVASRRSGLPPRLATAVDRCLAATPDRRFPSAEALADALSEVESRAAEIPPQVRNFMRMAEQTTLLLVMVTAVLLPSLDRQRGGALAGAFGLLAAFLGAGLDLGRRARGLLRDGFGAGDVIRAFVLEREARDEEIAALFRKHDPRRHARRQRLGLLLFAAASAAFFGLLSVGDTFPVGSTERRVARVGGMIVLLFGGVIAALLTGGSPQSEWRMGATAARLWRSAFAVYFFRLAGLGLRQEERTGGGDVPPALSDALPPLRLSGAVRARFPALPQALRDADALLDALRRRAGDMERLMAESAPIQPGIGASGGAAPIATARAQLAARRVSLLADLQAALADAHDRHGALLTARENLRLQLAWIDAGLATPDVLAPDVQLLAAAVDDAAAGGHASAPAPPTSGYSRTALPDLRVSTPP
jgi:serine/threonine-protein kinase